MGGTMTITGTLKGSPALGIVFALAAGPQAPARPVALSSERVSAPMELEGARPVVAVTINGRGPYRFILDTGAHGSVVSKSLADELGLPVSGESELRSPAGGSGVVAKVVTIDRLAIGGASASGVVAASMDFASMFPSPEAPRGILSPSVFPGVLLTLDYPKQEVVVQRGELPAPDGSEVFEDVSEDGLPMIPLTVAGRSVKAHVDTGSPGGISLPKAMAADLPLASPLVEKHRARTVDKEFVIMGAPLKGELKLGRYTLENPDLAFTDLPVANVGSDFLRRYAVTLDVRNHRVRLEEGATAPPPSPAPRRYGVRMIPSSSGGLEVAGTDPGSPAEKAGLRAGDRIVSVNGKETKALDPAGVAALMRVSPVTLVIEREGKQLVIEMSLDERQPGS
jgi:predicted aspartyl protease